jgi:hypothetical protein
MAAMGVVVDLLTVCMFVVVWPVMFMFCCHLLNPSFYCACSISGAGETGSIRACPRRSAATWSMWRSASSSNEAT